MKGQIIVIMAAAIIGWSCPAAAGNNRWAVSTNLPTWALLGTINADIHYQTSSHWCIEAGAKYNPFKYTCGETSQIQLRQLTPHIGIRYWIHSANNGWYLGSRLIASEYSVSYPFGELFFDGDLAGGELNFGYSWPLGEKIRLEAGAGTAAAYGRTAYYAGPVCGRILDIKRGWTIFPSELRLSLSLIL